MKGMIILSKKKNMKNNEIMLEMDITQVSSSGDCTGLIPAAITDDQQIDAYQEMYNFLPPEPAREINSKKQEKP